MTGKGGFVVKAAVGFADALTGKTFHPGDEVPGWDEVRAKHYEGRGLVRVIAAAFNKENGQMSLDDAKGPGPEVVKETDGDPGPEKTKETEPEPAKASGTRTSRASKKNRRIKWPFGQ